MVIAESIVVLEIISAMMVSTTSIDWQTAPREGH
jgi:hypothetical protein